MASSTAGLALCIASHEDRSGGGFHPDELPVVVERHHRAGVVEFQQQAVLRPDAAECVGAGKARQPQHRRERPFDDHLRADGGRFDPPPRFGGAAVEPAGAAAAAARAAGCEYGRRRRWRHRRTMARWHRRSPRSGAAARQRTAVGKIRVSPCTSRRPPACQRARPLCASMRSRSSTCAVGTPVRVRAPPRVRAISLAACPDCAVGGDQSGGGRGCDGATLADQQGRYHAGVWRLGGRQFEHRPLRFRRRLRPGDQRVEERLLLGLAQLGEPVERRESGRGQMGAGPDAAGATMVEHHPPAQPRGRHARPGNARSVPAPRPRPCRRRVAPLPRPPAPGCGRGSACGRRRCDQDPGRRTASAFGGSELGQLGENRDANRRAADANMAACRPGRNRLPKTPPPSRSGSVRSHTRSRRFPRRAGSAVTTTEQNSKSP